MHSGFNDPSLDSADTFRSVMNALARPGTLHPVTEIAGPDPLDSAMVASILTLIDNTTPIYVQPQWDSPELRQWMAFHTGAPWVEADKAVFALGTLEGLGDLSRFAKGTDQYPDRGCTLLIQLAQLENSGACLTGPGIQTQAHLNIPYRDDWDELRGPYPLGLDMFFVCADQIAGLPRSTQVRF